MNIFVTDPCPMISAFNLDDRRVMKMIIESSQMLSTAMHVIGIPDLSPPLKKTHVNHPCSVWVRSSQRNFTWLHNHMHALVDEFNVRFNKRHKFYDHFDVYSRASYELFDMVTQGKFDLELTPFVNCTQFKGIDVHEAYRRTLLDKWKNDTIRPRVTFTHLYHPPVNSIGIINHDIIQACHRDNFTFTMDYTPESAILSLKKGESVILTGRIGRDEGLFPISSSKHLYESIHPRYGSIWIRSNDLTIGKNL